MAAMPGFSHRQRPDCARDCATHVAVAAAVIVAFVSGLAPNARAQEEHLSRTGQADHPIVIREHAGWGMDCDAIAPPTLYLYEPPRHGRVCARVADIRIHDMYVGTESQCIGRSVRGVQFIYRPDQGYAGSDGLRYATKYPSVMRVVSVTVKVTADPRVTPIMAPSTIAAPIPQAPASAAPVPVCDELVF
jgi:uncharacterized RmlC-like cupin family protein